MKLLVIEGGRRDDVRSLTPPQGGEPAGGARWGLAPTQAPRGPPEAADVHAEARRRLRLSGYDVWSLRSFATGAAIPRPLRHLQMQIAFSAEALARLDPIPEDFRSDVYWPPGLPSG